MKHHETKGATVTILPCNRWFIGSQHGGHEMTNDFVAISAGMLVVSLVVWSLWGNPQTTGPPNTHAVRILADDPTLKLVSEKSSYMRTER